LALFAARAWYELIPDQAHTVVTAGYGTFLSTGSVNGSDYATAARTADELGKLIADFNRMADELKRQRVNEFLQGFDLGGLPLSFE
jgi:HAMP domain-containing protein